MSESITESTQLSPNCPQCGKPVGPAAPQGICPDCLLGNQLLHSSAHRSSDFASGPLIDELPNKDITLDASGKARFVDPLKPGQHVGEFEIIRRLGRGGMGTVYEAQDTSNKRRVALKVLIRPVENDQARERFLREGRLAASINHPNSVFVFGTHQADGLSLISMELVDGGTLEQRVRKLGPLPPREVVDAALQIIDGLDAAYSLGVLHRDIKPANCFVAEDGTIKVGDYGLSISTDPQFDARLTTEGSFLGTPAFSSPEQLRGDTLDVRSDIYALGVTLYYLLTGKTPFKADGMVKLMAMVLESSPETPISIRSDIPKELSQIVLRCLSKEPGDRFRNYAELREALLPFSSEKPEPVSLGWRTVAGLIDSVLLSIPGFVVTVVALLPNEVVLGTNYVANRWMTLVILALCVLYYSLSESAFGQTFGKWAVRLRAVDANGSSPGYQHSMIRAACFVLFPKLISLPYHLLSDGISALDVRSWEDSWPLVMAMAVGLSDWLLFGVMFSTARRGNGFAGLHGLVSGTRIVSCEYETRVSIKAASPAAPSVSDKSKVGPYHVLETLTSPNGNMLVGYDTVMFRRVWLRQVAGEAGPRTGERGSFARTTRLRWLNRFTEEGKCWDVYEAPSGQPLIDLLNQPFEWQVAKYWLQDLASELPAAVADGTLPQNMSAANVWVTESGRVKLLDFPASDAASIFAAAEAQSEIEPTARANSFLVDLASRMQKALARNKSTTLPPPAYAMAMFNSLAKENNFAVNARSVRAAACRREVSPKRRRVMMAVAYYAFPLLAMFSFLLQGIYSARFFHANPDIRELYGIVVILDQYNHSKDAAHLEQLVAENLELADSLRDDVNGYHRYRAAITLIAGEYSTILDDGRMDTLPVASRFHLYLRRQMEEAASAPAPTPVEIENARQLLKDEIAEHAATLPELSFSILPSSFSLAIAAWLFYVFAPSLLTAILFRGGLILRCFQATVVRMNGNPASRFTVFVRNLITFIPAILIPFFTPVVGIAPFERVEPQPLLAFAAMVVIIALIVVSNFVGLRSIPDRILGTAVVSK